VDTAAAEKTMSQIARNTALGTFCLLGALGSALLCAQPLPKAETILDRYVEVTGGRAAYEKRQSEVLIGIIEFPAQGLKGKLTRYSAAPDQEYSIVDLEGIGTIESGVHGGAAWEKSVLLGPRLKTGEEKDQAIREAHFNAPIEWRKFYQTASTAGTQTIDGEDCYEVLLTPSTGKPEHQFYSRKTGLLVRTAAVAASQMGDVEVEVDVGEYRSFGGVLIPTRSKQKAASQELSITVEEMRVNETIPATRFEPPADVGAMIRKAGAGQ
jgi:hypothetical protein